MRSPERLSRVATAMLLVSVLLAAVDASAGSRGVPVVLVSIAVTPSNPSIPAGATQQFTASGTFSDGSTQDVTALATWSSATPAVANVSNAAGSEGRATGVAPGTSTISARLDVVTGSTTLTVTSAVLQAIEVTPIDPNVAAGSTLQFTATGTYSNGSMQDLTAVVSWSSSLPAVATISNAAGAQGLAIGVGAGMTDIAATLGAINGSTSLTVTVGFCPSAPVTCKAPGATRLTVRNASDDRHDRLEFGWTLGDATTPGELGDPTSATQYTVCVWDRVGGAPTLVMEMVAPAGDNCRGRPCWRSTSNGRVFRYRDIRLLPDGIREMTLESGSSGKARVLVRAQGAVLPDPPMPFQQDPSITVQVINSMGSCWGVDFVSPPQVNTAAQLKVKERP